MDLPLHRSRLAGRGRRSATPATPAMLAGLAAVLSLTVPGVAGCTTAPSPAATGSPAARATASPRASAAGQAQDAAAWVQRCTEQVSYWVRMVAENPQHSYDYQEMGLSDATYLAYLEVDAAVPERGAVPASSWLTRAASAGCRRNVPDQPSSGTGWG